MSLPQFCRTEIHFSATDAPEKSKKPRRRRSLLVRQTCHRPYCQEASRTIVVRDRKLNSHFPRGVGAVRPLLLGFFTPGLRDLYQGQIVENDDDSDHA